MTPFRSSAGVVDRLAGVPLPDEISLTATVLSKRPNLDGFGVAPNDIVSDTPITLTFSSVREELRNTEKAMFFLTGEPHGDLYLLLHDATGEPYAKGSVEIGSGATGWIHAAAETLSIRSRIPSTTRSHD